jgi:type VI protein secretion system component Hcp
MSIHDSISRREANVQNQAVELSEQQLENVAGGTKTVDAASPGLFAFCCNGKHIPTGTITVR